MNAVGAHGEDLQPTCRNHCPSILQLLRERVEQFPPTFLLLPTISWNDQILLLCAIERKDEAAVYSSFIYKTVPV